MKQRRYAATLWCDQVDAAAKGDAEAKLGDGGGARVQGRREEEEEVKRWREKKEMTLGPIYKVKGGGDRRENRGARILDT